MRFFIRTFGCQMNKADSEMMAGLMVGAGHEPVSALEEADIAIYNTCSVRAHAEERLDNHVKALAAWKKDGRLIAVGGCVAEQEGQAFSDKFPFVDIVFGTRNFDTLPVLIDERVATGHPVVETHDGARHVPEGIPVLRRERVRAWVPVIRGCSNFCSYCIVPSVRGPEESRKLPDIVRDVESFVDDGVKEITLLGQNVNCYGTDLYGSSKFADLLTLLNGIDGLERIRFMTSHPKDLTDEIIHAMAASSKVCEYLHLPLQSGSDAILKAMNRKYTSAEYLETVAKVRAAMPGIAVSTDIIVGFPGETDEDFRRTMETMDRVGFDSAYMFIYSKRPGTPAASSEEQVPKAVKHERFDQLLSRVNEVSLEKNDALIGSEVEIFVEGASRKGEGMMAGRSRTNKMVNYPGRQSDIDTFKQVKITEATSFSLKGEPCGRTEETPGETSPQP